MKRTIIAAAALAASFPAAAGDINPANLTMQSEVRALTKDLGSVLSYKPLIPSEPLGITGFDVGLGFTGTRLGDPGVFAKAGGGNRSNAYSPSLRLDKGLPFGFDVGAVLGEVAGTNIRYWGGELRYALISGNVALPAVAIRGSYTRMTGVDQMELNTKGLDLSVSKGFALFTPYAGVGAVWTTGTPTGTAFTKEKVTQGKVFAGINANFGLTNVALEADRTGDAATLGMKLGFRF